MMIRIYALYERSWRVLAFFSAVVAAAIVVACVRLYNSISPVQQI